MHPNRPALLLSALALAGLSSVPPAIAAGPKLAELPPDQLVVLQEAHNIVASVGDVLWPGWTKTPKTTLLLDDQTAFLIGLPNGSPTPPGFTATGERFGRRPIYSRPRVLSRTLRTAMVVEGVPAAVVGSWRANEESPNEWAISLVRQWFHLLQLQRGEEAKAGRLATAPSERPGWQVNYHFPFDDPDVGNAMLLLGDALYDFVSQGPLLPRAAQRSFQGETAIAALQNLETVLTAKYGPEAYSFFRLRTWREGVARYSGVVIARLVATAERAQRYRASGGFDKLAEHHSYVRVWEDSYANQAWLIRTAQMDDERHLTSFDALGHGMAVMLDVLDEDWRDRYFDDGVWLDDMITTSLRAQATTPRASARR